MDSPDAADKIASASKTSPSKVRFGFLFGFFFFFFFLLSALKFWYVGLGFLWRRFVGFVENVWGLGEGFGVRVLWGGVWELVLGGFVRILRVLGCGQGNGWRFWGF